MRTGFKNARFLCIINFSLPLLEIFSRGDVISASVKVDQLSRLVAKNLPYGNETSEAMQGKPEDTTQDLANAVIQRLVAPAVL